MAEKTVTEKMFIKPNEVVLLVNLPMGFDRIKDKLPQGCRVAGKYENEIDTIICFLISRIEMEKELPELKNRLKKNGKLWIAYPKGTSKVKTDIHRDSIAEYGNSIGLQAVAIISLDETWSGLRFKLTK